MKSPEELAQRLSQQWNNPDLREERLIGEASWPIELSIGIPSPSLISSEWSSVISHIRTWRAVKTGDVIFKPVTYRATGEPVDMPVTWQISSETEWVKASDSQAVTSEYAILKRLISESDPLFHKAFIRHRSLWKDKSLSEIIKAAEVAMLLEPGCARGMPLRTISLAGIDSKFFERHRSLILRLLDLRFDGEASKHGLEVFLNAWRESDHWLLAADLDGSLLSFSQQRVRSSELRNAALDVPNLLVIENERCLHLLPQHLPGTIAVLGAGNNLSWLSAPWVTTAKVGYWGDLDTWGLTLLASARTMAPQLSALLMTRQIFDKYAEKHSVSEPVFASAAPPDSLNESEHDLYCHLVSIGKGRIEQEFLSRDDVCNCLNEWAYDRMTHPLR